MHLRTIQRDLNERFAFLPLEKTGDAYRLHPGFLGKLSLRDIERFAGLARVRGLFPSLSDDFLRDIFDSRLQSALLVKGPNYEDLSGKEDSLRQLEQAILGHYPIAFEYQKNEGPKTYSVVEPYKLVNQDGIWYLAAKDDGKLKAYTFSKIDQLKVSGNPFTPDPAVNTTLAEEDGGLIVSCKVTHPNQILPIVRGVVA